MKLNEKGKAKLRNLCNTLFWAIETGDPVEDFNFAVESFDFKGDDFTDCIVLTVNQAKELALKLMSNDEFFFRQTGEFDYDTETLLHCLIDKIEQVGRGKG